MSRIQINSADLESLMKLPGVGTAIANDIIEIRKEEFISAESIEQHLPRLRTSERFWEMVGFDVPSHAFTGAQGPEEEEGDSQDFGESNIASGSQHGYSEDEDEVTSQDLRGLQQKHQILDLQKVISSYESKRNPTLGLGSQERDREAEERMGARKKDRNVEPPHNIGSNGVGNLPKRGEETQLGPLGNTLVQLIQSQQELLKITNETSASLMTLVGRSQDGRGPHTIKSEPHAPPRRGDAKQSSFRPPSSLYYSGATSWKSFYAKFQSYCIRMEFDETERLDFLMWCLTEKAGEFLANLRERQPLIEYREVMQILKKRFGQTYVPEQQMAEFMATSQREGEQLQDWADRIFDLGFRAYPNYNYTNLEKLAVTRFCQGCIDKAAGQAVIASPQRPNTMDSAIQAIRWYQLNSQVIFGNKRKEVRQVVAVEDEDEDPMSIQAVYNNQPSRFQNSKFSKQSPQQNPAQPSLRSKVDDIEKKLDSLILALKSNPDLKIPVGTSSNLTKTQTTRCYKCGDEGHFARECTKTGQRNQARISQVNEEVETEPLNFSGSGEMA